MIDLSSVWLVWPSKGCFMPAANNDVVTITLQGIYGTSSALFNVFKYRINDTGTIDHIIDHPDLWAQAFWDANKAALRGIMTTLCKYTYVKAYVRYGANEGVGGEYGIPTGEQPGTVAAETMPSFVAISFRMSRPNSQFNHHYKRFGGVPETFQAENALTSGGLTPIATMATALKTPVAVMNGINNTGSLVPVLLRETVNGVRLTAPLVADVNQASFDRIGHVSSRDIGRGL